MEKVEVYLIPNNYVSGVTSYGLEALKINYLDLYKRFISLGYENSNYKEIEMFSKEDNVLVLEYFQSNARTYKNVMAVVASIARRINNFEIKECEIVTLDVSFDETTFEGLVFSTLPNALPDLKVTEKLISLKGEDI